MLLKGQYMVNASECVEMMEYFVETGNKE